ncbi:hypothetical protein [Pleionea sp. CnH1-48]|uniref:hypothetical protein n=1 Tax=Pleionea sp. CnH1-48 TaxID=2954494 RepID=UPI002097A40E|nr:hypothetical protein [Pleionea sp. CnH1-48]MCO7227005.1 hypothetical protein [Pleionea sp. CnH1-48]
MAMQQINFTSNDSVLGTSTAFMDYVNKLVQGDNSAIAKAQDDLDEIQNGSQSGTQLYDTGVNDIQYRYEQASDMLNWVMETKADGKYVDWVEGTWATIAVNELDMEKGSDGKVKFKGNDKETKALVEQLKNIVDEFKTDLDLRITDASEQSQKIQLIIQLASGAIEALGNTLKTQGQTI